MWNAFSEGSDLSSPAVDALSGARRCRRLLTCGVGWDYGLKMHEPWHLSSLWTNELLIASRYEHLWILLLFGSIDFCAYRKEKSRESTSKIMGQGRRLILWYKKVGYVSLKHVI